MFSSIRERLWLSYAALIVTALAVVASVLTLFLIRNPYIYRQTTLRIVAAENLLSQRPGALGRVDVVATALDVRVIVLSQNGTVISDTTPAAARLGTRDITGRPRNVEMVRDAGGKVWLLSRGQLPDGGWLLVAAPRPRLLPAVELIRDELWRPLLQGGLLALVLALILAFLLARWIADPLQRLVRAARSVAATRSPSGKSVDQDVVDSNTSAVERLVEGGPREVRELTRAFKAMLERVETSQRSQKEFVANVSHELKTPLTSIQGFAQAILDGTADTPEKQHQAATIIHDEAARMHRMALDLLDLARLDAGTADLHMSNLDVGELVESIVEKFQPTAAAGLALEFSRGDSPLAVQGDRERLAQVFFNLIDNALKFTPSGGRVTVRLRKDHGEIQVSVTDTGAGIAPQEISHIFDRFYQADLARRGGTDHGAGLGLAIAREIAQAHGGRITVRSELGRGAEFVVHLPPLEGSRGARAAA